MLEPAVPPAPAVESLGDGSVGPELVVEAGGLVGPVGPSPVGEGWTVGCGDVEVPPAGGRTRVRGAPGEDG
ncbi:hypothetical protein, partial [Actinacidiphila rubida]|uniref:hypothetical protein n=1 Tax=Actinacidiphila rubida TaxID=310780 RepID=UPI001C401CAC